MFNNLIESSSHVREYKRRGSFLLFTGATYVVLFLITGVISIYAYDARLEDQTEEYLVELLPPQPVPDREPAPAARPEQPRSTRSNDSNVAVREDPMLSVNHPEVVPENISATPNRNPPIPDHGVWRRDSYNSDPVSMGGPAGPSTGGRVVAQPPTVIDLPDPPPAPDPPKPPKVIKVSQVLNSRALSLPRPNYPALARNIRLQGTVNVQVLIDEEGRVISAKAVSGHPILIPDAQRAAMQARFSPTVIGDQAVKVSGVITYNFVLSN